MGNVNSCSKSKKRRHQNSTSSSENSKKPKSLSRILKSSLYKKKPPSSTTTTLSTSHSKPASLITFDLSSNDDQPTKVQETSNLKVISGSNVIELFIYSTKSSSINGKADA